MNARKSVGIFGSRDIDRQAARELFEQQLSFFLHQGRIWYFGGGHGTDEWVAEWLLEQNETCWIIIPYTIAEAPRALRPRVEQVERIVELQLPKRKSAYSFRNRYIVDQSEIVIGFRSGKGGGTYATLRYALRKQKEVHAYPVGQNEND